MKKLLKLLNNIPELIASIGFVIMICVVTANVLLRFFLHKSLVWTEEVAAMGFIWSIYVGAAACYKRGSLISIDILVSLLPGKLKHFANIITSLIMVAATILLCWLSFKFSMSAMNKLSLSLRVPYTCFDIATTFGFLYMIFYSIRDLIYVIRGIEIKTDSDSI